MFVTSPMASNIVRQDFYLFVECAYVKRHIVGMWSKMHKDGKNTLGHRNNGMYEGRSRSLATLIEGDRVSV